MKVTTAFIWKLEVALPRRAAMTNWFCNRGSAERRPDPAPLAGAGEQLRQGDNTCAC